MVGLAVFAGSIVCAYVAFRASTPIVAVPSEIDLGPIAVGEIVTHDVPLFNRGMRPLHIRRLRTSCNCTECSVSTDVVEPGQEATLTVTVRGQNVQHGIVRVLLETNDSSNPIASVLFQYSQQQAVDIRPRRLDFGRVEQHELPVELEIDIRVLDSQLKDSQLRVSIEPTLDWFEWKLVDDLSRGSWKLVGSLGKDSPAGVSETKILVRDASGQISEVIPLYANIVQAN